MNLHPMEFENNWFKPDKMTKRERLGAMMKGKPLDRIPFIPFVMAFAARNSGVPLAKYYSDPEWSFVVQRRMSQQYGFDLNPVYGYADYGAWEFGGEARYPTGPYEQAIIVTRRPALTKEQAWALELPEVTKDGYLPVMLQFARLQKQYSGSASCFGMTPFSIAVSLAGEENFCRWMMTDPDLCHHLLRLATDHSLQVIKYWIDALGFESLRVDRSSGPETNDIISGEQFKEFALPYMKEVCGKSLAMGFRHIFVHICGNQRLNWQYWKEIPLGDPGLITVAHQESLSEVVNMFGDKCVIYGNIEPALILEGEPEQVYEACRKAIQVGKTAKRGYVLCTGCEIPPDSPPYNLFVMRKAIDDFGWY